jgi:DNA polymerase-3 subunit beta
MYKLSVNVGKFAHSLALAGKCIDSKPTIPIMADVLISNDGNGFMVSSSNAEMRIDQPIEMSMVEGEFAPFCVNYGKLSTAVSTLSKDTDITLVIDGNKLVVNHTTGKFAIPVENADEYPITPKLVEDDEENKVISFKCNASMLIKNLNLAKNSVSTDNLRPQFCGVCFDIVESKLNIVSTNGQTMFLVRDEAIEPFNGESITKQIIVPATALNAIATVFADSNDVNVTTDSRNIFITNNSGVKYCVRLTEGKFPNYNALFPELENRSVKVDKNILETILKRANIFTNAITGMVIMTKTGSNLVISGEDLDLATSTKESLPILNESGVEEGFRIGCNLGYLFSMLATIDDTEVVFNFDTPQRAFTIVEDDETSNKTALVMPMNI